MRFTAHRDRLHRTKKREFNNACRFYSRPKKLNDSIVLKLPFEFLCGKGRAEAERMAAACAGASKRRIGAIRKGAKDSKASDISPQHRKSAVNGPGVIIVLTTLKIDNWQAKVPIV